MRNLIITYNKNETKNILSFDNRVIHLIDEFIYGELTHQRVFAEDKLRYYVAGMTQINVKDIVCIELNESPDCESRTLVARYPY